MPEWKLSADERSWEYRDGARVLNSIRFERNAYHDMRGNNLGRNFNKARTAAERGEQVGKQARLAL